MTEAKNLPIEPVDDDTDERAKPTIMRDADLRPDRHTEKAEDLRIRAENWVIGESHCVEDLPAELQAELEAGWMNARACAAHIAVNDGQDEAQGRAPRVEHDRATTTASEEPAGRRPAERLQEHQLSDEEKFLRLMQTIFLNDADDHRQAAGEPELDPAHDGASEAEFSLGDLPAWARADPEVSGDAPD